MDVHCPGARGCACRRGSGVRVDWTSLLRSGQAGPDLEMQSAAAVEVVVGFGMVVGEPAYGRLGCDDLTVRCVCVGGMGGLVMVSGGITNKVCRG